MAEEKIVIRFTQSHSRPGGPGYNPGEQAAFTRTEADTILALNRGIVVRSVSDSPRKSKSLDQPPHDKQIKKPGKKKIQRPKLEIG
jgi:hypothetical protein